MNWLIWIGGGFIFEIIVVGFLKCLAKDDVWTRKVFTSPDKVIIVGVFFSPLLIWIWICWRFIQ